MILTENERWITNDKWTITEIRRISEKWIRSEKR